MVDESRVEKCAKETVKQSFVFNATHKVKTIRAINNSVCKYKHGYTNAI